MSGPNSGGKAKVTRELQRLGFQAAGSRRALKKLSDEKAVCPPQTKRPLLGGTRAWKALRADKTKL
eukprot:9192057-Pyramimonas_sp.AAC.1